MTLDPTQGGRPDRKLCVLCKRFDFDGGWPHYSDLTPGSSASMSCDKGMWKEDMDYMTATEYRRLMLTAETCAHFTLADDLQPQEGEEKP